MRRILTVLLASLALVGTSNSAHAHEVRPAYLQIRQTADETFAVLWKVPTKGGLRLRLHATLPERCTPLAPRAVQAPAGASVERWTVTCSGGLAGETVGVEGLGETLTDALVRIEWADGATQVERLTAETPSIEVLAAPSVLNTAGTYLHLGVEHILLGIDHLLFVLALLILVKGTRRLVGTITAFTLAHSITLVAATLGWADVPGAPVEAVIALSIVFVAAEIVHGQRGREGITARAPWIVALVFGLLHGFGFAGALHEVGLPGHAIPLALFMFNVGVEVGQLIFVATALLGLAIARRVVASVPKWLEWVPAYAIGAIAMFWTLQRVSSFG